VFFAFFYLKRFFSFLKFTFWLKKKNFFFFF